jgi:hypothetical protein
VLEIEVGGGAAAKGLEFTPYGLGSLDGTPPVPATQPPLTPDCHNAEQETAPISATQYQETATDTAPEKQTNRQAGGLRDFLRFIRG